MPQAPVPAALAALASAGLTIGQLDAVTTHNPFAVNDSWQGIESQPIGPSGHYGHKRSSCTDPAPLPA